MPKNRTLTQSRFCPKCFNFKYPLFHRDSTNLDFCKIEFVVVTCDCEMNKLYDSLKGEFSGHLS